MVKCGHSRDEKNDAKFLVLYPSHKTATLWAPTMIWILNVFIPTLFNFTTILIYKFIL